MKPPTRTRDTSDASTTRNLSFHCVGSLSVQTIISKFKADQRQTPREIKHRSGNGTFFPASINHLTFPVGVAAPSGLGGEWAASGERGEQRCSPPTPLWRVMRLGEEGDKAARPSTLLTENGTFNFATGQRCCAERAGNDEGGCPTPQSRPTCVQPRSQQGGTFGTDSSGDGC